MDNQELYAHNAALIAVLVLGNNGHLGFSHTLQTREQKLLLSRRDRKSLQVHTHERSTGFTGLLTIHVRWYQSTVVKFQDLDPPSLSGYANGDKNRK